MDEPGTDLTGSHSVSMVYRRCGEPTRRGKLHGNNGQASAASHENGGSHYRGHVGRGLQWNYWVASTITVRYCGFINSSQNEVPNAIWDWIIHGS
ncbi:hypothetical protein LIER_36712 [Lithospermum erythrorhizon]|uniref:Uncharacterized protein n=1 Tax=Lithospermum erythrorhizon TaxID=34254 RepID=A0AAV3P9S3_LITER